MQSGKVASLLRAHLKFAAKNALELFETTHYSTDQKPLKPCAADMASLLPACLHITQV